MPHVPHVYLPGPWEGPELALPAAASHHLRRVLRRGDGAAVTYTDGAGALGDGSLGAGVVRRGDERTVAAPQPAVAVAVAPLRSTDRARYLVEKLAELGVDRLVWFPARHAQAGPPKPERARAWAVAALEQSRGAHLLAIDEAGSGDLPGDVWVADPAGGPPPADPGGPITVIVGPEGGLAPGEAPPGARPVALGPRVLRTETAAVAAALVALQAAGRFPTPRRTA